MAISGFDYKLSWDKDFPEKNRFDTRPAGKIYDSETHARWIRSKPEYGRNGNKVVITKVDITIIVVRKNNWVLKNKMLDELLKHEQGHYDITALLARDCHHLIRKTAAPSIADFNKKLKNVDEAFESKYAVLHERYDDQTKHGADKSAQEAWNKRIKAEKSKLDGSTDNLP